MIKVHIYNYYNRFWHWMQAMLILFLALSGFEVHGSIRLFGYENAVLYHTNAAWALIILIVFTIFWDFTIGEWRQYIPTSRNIKAQIAYYVTGIFKKAPHPTHKTIYNKFNPLQRLTYLALKVLIIPVVIGSGLAYYFFFSNIHHTYGPGLARIAHLHTLGAFLLLGFVIVHVYLTTTGHRISSSLKAMLTGWEEMSEEDARFAVAEGLQVKMDEMQSQIAATEKESILEEALTALQNRRSVSQKTHEEGKETD
jgi:thiosulfate reductase cytochrome b subunit